MAVVQAIWVKTTTGLGATYGAFNYNTQNYNDVPKVVISTWTKVI